MEAAFASPEGGENSHNSRLSELSLWLRTMSQGGKVDHGLPRLCVSGSDPGHSPWASDVFLHNQS